MSFFEFFTFLVRLLRENAEAFVAFLLGVGIAVALTARFGKGWLRNRDLRRELEECRSKREAIEIESGTLRDSLAGCTREKADVLDGLKACEKTGADLREQLRLCGQANEELREALGASNEENAALRERLADCEDVAKKYEEILRAVQQEDQSVWSIAPHQPDRLPGFVPRGPRRKAVVIAFFNLKGGVGKTTLAANLGALWATEKKLLVIDLDYQQSVSEACIGVERTRELRTQEHVIDRLWMHGPNKTPRVHTLWAATPENDGLRVVVAGARLSEVETAAMIRWIAKEWEGDVRLRLRADLHSTPIADDFDYVLIDCPPRLTTACVNGLAAADFVVVPTLPDGRSIEAVGRAVAEVRHLSEAVPAVFEHVQVIGVAGNRMNPRAPAQEMQEWDRFKASARVQGFRVFDSTVRNFTAKAKESRFQALHPDHRAEFEALSAEIERYIA